VGSTALTAGAPYLLDTHIWFWFVHGSDRLAPSLRSALAEAAGDLWLSPVSVWELGLLHLRGRVRLDPGPRGWITDALTALPLIEAPVTHEVAQRSNELELVHRDPADRFLAATVLVYRLTLVTVDERLLSVPWLPTRSA
jgi:PIN domain nuclease of toxin-antitoxin system